MKRILLSLSFLLAFQGVLLAHTNSVFFDKADGFLRDNVSNGRVDYNGIKANQGELNTLVALIKNFKLNEASSKEQKAFALNAYNILVIKNVIDHMPIAKPTDVTGFFDGVKFNVAGAMLTLSDIENKKIRPVFKDARVHFALVCAGRGCPPLLSGAYLPEKVDAQLTAITKKAMNDAEFIRVDAASKKVAISKIFEWYKEDFLAEASDFIAFINKYRSTPIPTTYSVTTYEYDWRLNIKN